MKTSFRVMVLASVLLLLATSVAAQSTTGYLTGKVTSDQAPLAGATVTISSPSLLGTRTATTDVNGVYFFAVLPPGEYTVRVESTGMETVIGGCAVLLSATSRFDAELTIAANNEGDPVKDASEPVMETPSVATNIQASLSTALIGPSDVSGAARIAAGVGANATEISGGTQGETLAMVDGVPITDVSGQWMPLFVEDSMQETTVLTAAIPAEYGRFTGGVVNAITKSGGNEFRGSIRDSLSNASWASERPGEQIGVDKVNSFYGVTLGGYLMRDRLWFFAAARDEKISAHLQTSRTNIPFEQATQDRRYEYKLSGLLSSNQNFVGSYLQNDKSIDNAYTWMIYDLASLVPSRNDPVRLFSGSYNATFSSRYVVEATYSERDAKFNVGMGGKRTSDLLAGSYMVDVSEGVLLNAPPFCGDCDVSTRNAESGMLKASWFGASPRFGSHTLAAGFDTFTEHMHDNSYMSASDFGFFVNGVYRPEDTMTPLLSPSGLLYPTALNGRAGIGWFPILEKSSAESDFNTRSLFVNDRWDLGSHFTFNLGLRYDRTHAQDANGNVVADESLLSPRLAAVYDPLADGRHRITAAYSRYATKVGQDPGLAKQSAGAPALIYFYYDGPDINPPGTPPEQLLDSRQVVAEMLNWLSTQAGGLTQDALSRYILANPGVLLAGYFPGYGAEIDGTLTAPHVNEWVLGYGIQIGRNFYAKADYIDRTWRDFYGLFILNGGKKITDPLGIVEDVTIVRNTNDATREYSGLQFQLGWRPGSLTIGATYTYSTLKGNAELYAYPKIYPELTDYPQSHPVAKVTAHRGKAWAAYDLKLPSQWGSLNLALLENYDSGGTYGAQGLMDPASYAEAEMGSYDYTYSNWGIFGYYFVNPDVYHLDAVTSTDLGLNYSHALSGRIELFLQGQVTNVFNEQGVVDVIRTVYTYFDDPNLAPFDPRTEKPVEGLNWLKDENFGKPYGPSSYQPARTYNLSFGLRF